MLEQFVDYEKEVYTGGLLFTFGYRNNTLPGYPGDIYLQAILKTYYLQKGKYPDGTPGPYELKVGKE